jgi:hypothetical protein
VPPTVRVALAALGLIAGAGCGPKGPDAGARAPGAADSITEQSASKAAKGKRTAKRSGEPVLDGVRCAAFVPFLPSVFEQFRAKGPAEGKDIELGEGAGLALTKRGYFKNGSALELEFVDTERSSSLRDLFARTRAIQRETSVAVIRPLQIQGYEAVAQWNETAKIARVTILVEHVLVNLSLRPSTALDTSLQLAERLDLAAVAKLQDE